MGGVRSSTNFAALEAAVLRSLSPPTSHPIPVALGSSPTHLGPFGTPPPPHHPRAPQQGATQTMQFIACCVQCCLKCIQWAVEVVTRNAYIIVALKGVSYCTVRGGARR